MIDDVIFEINTTLAFGTDEGPLYTNGYIDGLRMAIGMLGYEIEYDKDSKEFKLVK